ncbi:MAG TPA: BON domain-containing protein [Candidatus Sulfotelmatobacter sp.]|nr:BON domain-containing protein [Candidatus Sulfotelmatobacter sp.]
MRRIWLSMSSFLLAAILAAGVGCAKKPDDATINTEIQSKFSDDSGLAGKQLGVKSENGVVTLSGIVDNEAQREAASRQAASVSGVTQVINNMQVGGTSPSAAAQPARAPSSAPPVATRPDARKGSRKSSKQDQSQGPDNQDPNSGAMAANDPPANPASAPPANQPSPVPAPPPAPKKLIIDQGTQISIRLIDPIDSEKNQSGDTFHATLNAPLSSDGQEAVPAGVELTGHLVEVRSAGKFAGQSMVSMQLDSLATGGKNYSLQTDLYKKTAASRGKNTAEKVGGGAVIGSIIGAIAGGGKGAAIGGAAGAGVGGGVQAASKSQQIKLPSETVLNFTLQAPITVEQAASPDANREKLGAP